MSRGLCGGGLWHRGSGRKGLQTGLHFLQEEEWGGELIHHRMVLQAQRRVQFCSRECEDLNGPYSSSHRLYAYIEHSQALPRSCGHCEVHMESILIFYTPEIIKHPCRMHNNCCGYLLVPPIACWDNVVVYTVQKNHNKCENCTWVIISLLLLYSAVIKQIVMHWSYCTFSLSCILSYAH